MHNPLQAVTGRQPTVRPPGAGVGGRGAVAAEHRPGPPAGQAHEVRLAAALGEPGVREGVAKLMRVQVGKAGLGTPAAKDLPDAVGPSGPRWPSHSQGSSASRWRARTRR